MCSVHQRKTQMWSIGRQKCSHCRCAVKQEICTDLSTEHFNFEPDLEESVEPLLHSLRHRRGGGRLVERRTEHHVSVSQFHFHGQRRSVLILTPQKQKKIDVSNVTNTSKWFVSSTRLTLIVLDFTSSRSKAWRLVSSVCFKPSSTIALMWSK